MLVTPRALSGGHSGKKYSAESFRKRYANGWLRIHERHVSRGNGRRCKRTRIG
jgi:hypothetical protein